MKPSEIRNEFNIQIDVHQCTISRGELDRMRAATESLARQVEHFPVANMHVLIEHNARTRDYYVKTDVFLTGTTLVCSENDPAPYTAFERCLERVAAELEAYKDRLGQVEERQKAEKATHQSIHPTSLPELEAVEAAVRDQDYTAFYSALLPFEEPVRKRVGRWVERYPEVQTQIGTRWEIADFVEEVFLNAFEKYDHRPQGEGFGDWLETLIDEAVKELINKPDEELENIRMARMARAVQQEA